MQSNQGQASRLRAEAESEQIVSLSLKFMTYVCRNYYFKDTNMTEGRHVDEMRRTREEVSQHLWELE